MEVKPSNHSSLTLRLNQAAEGAPSGCVLLEYSFHSLVRVELAEIRFTNYYVAVLSVRARFKVGAAAETRNMRAGASGCSHRWRTVLKHRALMPNPHLLTGSQDPVVLREKDFRVPLRVSSCWKKDNFQVLLVCSLLFSGRRCPAVHPSTALADVEGV